MSDPDLISSQVLVGSSMGAWIALHLAIAHPNRISALVGIAPGIDFFDRTAASLTSEDRKRLFTDGSIQLPTTYE